MLAQLINLCFYLYLSVISKLDFPYYNYYNYVLGVALFKHNYYYHLMKELTLDNCNVDTLTIALTIIVHKNYRLTKFFNC